MFYIKKEVTQNFKTLTALITRKAACEKELEVLCERRSIDLQVFRERMGGWQWGLEWGPNK